VLVEGYNLPDDLYYEENHYWVRPEGGLLVVGMDDFAQKLAGPVVYVQLPTEGKRLAAGKKFARVESGKWLGKINAPVNGELAASNEALETKPGLINEDCYGAGWMFKIRPDDPAELERLIHGPAAVEAWVKADIKRYSKE
jgi:glycine cleavage system H protein